VPDYLYYIDLLAGAALDRLINRSHHLILEGRSYRPLLRPDRVPALAKGNEPEQDQSDSRTMGWVNILAVDSSRDGTLPRTCSGRQSWPFRLLLLSA
jgi:hypothetical protein